MPRFIAMLLLVLLARPSWGASAPVAAGAQFQVNSYTPGNQRYPAVATASGGEFVVVWISEGSSADDNQAESVQGQRYAADGTPVGSEFQVNTYITGSQAAADIALRDDGEFVVVWRSTGSAGTDLSDASIQGRRFAADGAPLGPDFQVNSYTTSAQSQPAAALAADGELLVVWQSDGSSGSDASNLSIQGRRFSPGGAPLGGEFQINGFTTSAQQESDVARAPGGEFTVVWESLDDLQARRYSAAATPLAAEFQVNAYAANVQRLPSIAMDSTGEIVMTWQSLGSVGTDPGFSVQGQLFSAEGAPSGEQFQVNSFTPSGQFSPTVARDVDGDFVVVWFSGGSSGTDTWSYSIQGQRYADDGAALGGEFQVNSYTPNLQVAPVVAMDGDGDFVVVWNSLGSPGSDSSSFSVQGQRFSVTGELPGRVFFDQNFDGLQGVAEPGIAGVTVELYDEQLALRRAVTTDGNGDYLLKPKEGSWHLRFAAPPAYSFTRRDVGSDDSTDSDVDPLDGETAPFPVAPGTLDDSIDAGLTNGVGDRVWNDLDHDGIRDGGEPGLEGVTVILRDKGGIEVAATATDATGRYHFNGMPPADYYVQFGLLAGFGFSPANEGADDDADSDADEATGTSPVFSFDLAEVDTSIDAGLFQLSAISGRVWHDVDHNGVREELGEFGLANVPVRLFDATFTTVVASTTTGLQGRYAFTELASASYFVEVGPLGALDFSPQDVGDDAIDSDVDPVTGRTPTLVFTAGSVVANIDAGVSDFVLLVDGFESNDFSRWSSVVTN